MSFQHKSFWMPREAGCLAEENTGSDNYSRPRIEAKHGYQWFTSTRELETFSNNKKQAAEAVSGRPISGVSHVNISPWDTNLRIHCLTSQFSDHHFGSEPVQTVKLVDKNMPSIGSGNLNMGRKDFDNHFGNDPSVGLSLSHAIKDPSSCLDSGSIRKVEVNEVRDSNNYMSSSMGHSYIMSENSTISEGAGYGKNDVKILLGSTYNNGNDKTVFMGMAVSKTDDNLVSMGHTHTFNKEGGKFMLMGNNYGKGDERILSMSQPFDRGIRNFMSVGQSYEKEDSSLISVITLSTSYNKDHENFISTDLTYSKSGEKFLPIAASCDKGTDHTTSFGPTYDKVDSNIASSVPPYDKGDSGSLTLGHNHNKGESSTISFGGFHDDLSQIPLVGSLLAIIS